MNLEKLDRRFYGKDVEKVAKELLGKYVVRRKSKEKTIGKIVETEAYLGEEDPASHSFGGKKTDRTEVMYGPPGYAYVYMIYGMYYCFNAITGEEGKPEGVFIRALEPIKGIDLMKERRDMQERSELTNGPGKLCMAMDIEKDLNGEDLLDDCLYIAKKETSADLDIREAKRINIDYAGEAEEWKLRFFIDGNDYVSELPR